MSFKPSNAVAIQDISGNIALITSGVGMNVNLVGGVAGAGGATVDASGRLAVNNPISYTSIRVPMSIMVTAASGGVALESGVADLVTIQNIGLSGAAMFVGTSADPPFGATIQSGKGFRLYNAGVMINPSFITLPTLGNMNNIRVVSVVSGQPVSYIGVQ